MRKENTSYLTIRFAPNFYRATISFPGLTLPLSCGTGNGDKSNVDSGNEIERVTVDEGETLVSYRA